MQFPELRMAMSLYYETFTAKYGELNKNVNRNRILADVAFGFKMLSSLEVRVNEKFVRSDIFHGPLFQQKQLLKTR
jgi:hypothetical protein